MALKKRQQNVWCFDLRLDDKEHYTFCALLLARTLRAIYIERSADNQYALAVVSSSTGEGTRSGTIVLVIILYHAYTGDH